MPIMSPFYRLLAVLSYFALVLPLRSQSTSTCSTSLTPTKSIKPSIASGYRAALIATGLTSPRTVQFDADGNLLVVQAGSGIISLQLQDDGGTCISIKSKKSLIANSTLNHGLALSNDGQTLYASSPQSAWAWEYNSTESTVSNTSKTVVTNMNTDDHTTRTLLMSQKVDAMLLISRGSTSNIDPEAEQLSSGHSQIRAFNLNNITSASYDFNTEGIRLGWGLRNSVGLSEHPVTGGVYSVENSVDQATRDGQDVHQDNPGEEMNFHGYLNGTAYAPQGRNYGYPYCFAAWRPDDLPDNGNLTVGSPFAIGSQNSTINDTYCVEQTNRPRLTFQAHMAPLDVAFNDSGTEGWVTFHGSWDRTNPVGYKVSVIDFVNGAPSAAEDNNTAITDIFANMDNAICPDHCFRPVGIAIDRQGRLFVSSDASGEIYVLVKDESSNGTFGGVPNYNGSPPTTSGSSTGGKTSGADRAKVTLFALLLSIVIVIPLIC